MAKSNGRGALRIYKSYNFVDKDPALDVIRTIVQRSGKSYKDIEEAGGPKAGTLHAWFDGKTVTPQNRTQMAAVRAAGGDILYIGHDGKSYKVNAARRG